MVSFVVAEEGADKCRQRDFTWEETDILVQEVQACNHQIYGTTGKLN